MDRMNLRYVDKPKEKKTISELEKRIDHYKSLYARTGQIGALEIVNELETELLELRVKEQPDEYKKFHSKLLGIKMNLNLTKGTVICSDGVFYTEKELLDIPDGIDPEVLKTIH